jgi:hypothetical protein
MKPWLRDRPEPLDRIERFLLWLDWLARRRRRKQG